MSDHPELHRAPPVRLRQRHVLCAIGLQGVRDVASMGYGSAFVTNLTRLLREQLNAEDQRVHIIAAVDAVCVSCPLRVGSECGMKERASRIDAAHGRALDLAPGQVLPWSECLDRVRVRVVPDDLDTLCTGCPLLPLGTCKAAVAALSGVAVSPVARPSQTAPPTPPAPR